MPIKGLGSNMTKLQDRFMQILPELEVNDILIDRRVKV